MFNTKKEKYAYIQGIKKGNRGGKPWGKQYKKKKRKRSKVITSGAYNSRGKINDGRVDDRHGPVVFFEDDFDYDSRGRIKGSYTPDGFFEPD